MVNVRVSTYFLVALLSIVCLSSAAAQEHAGCSNPTDEGMEIAESVIGKLDWEYFDFRTLILGAPLDRQSPEPIQAICNVIRETGPIEDEYNKLSFFDAGTHFVLITHLYDPDPSDNTIVLGLSTVGVYDRSGQFVEAMSF